MNKFVAIITQPLMTNYGCLLQNWAMQQAVNKLGYQSMYLQLIISQYFISNKSGIWSLSLIVHSKG